MGKACSVCSLDAVAAFDADSDAGLSVRALAAKYSVSLGAVNRHREHKSSKAGGRAADPDRNSRARSRGPTLSSTTATKPPRGKASTDPDRVGELLPADYPEGWLKRLRAAAAQLQDRSRIARVNFIRELGRDFVPKETCPVLAEVWGIPEGTVKNDASVAWISIRLEGDPEVARAAFWQDLYEEIDQAQELRRIATETLMAAQEGKLLERYDAGDGSEGVRIIEPMGVKFLADNFDRAAAAAGRCRDHLAKATGIISSSTTINLTAVLGAMVPVEILGDQLKVSDLEASYGRVVELILGARTLDDLKLAVRNELRGLRGRDPVTVEASAPPAGGETK